MPKESERSQRLLSAVAEAVERVAKKCGDRERYEADMRQTAEAMKTAIEAYVTLYNAIQLDQNSRWRSDP